MYRLVCVRRRAQCRGRRRIESSAEGRAQANGEGLTESDEIERSWREMKGGEEVDVD